MQLQRYLTRLCVQYSINVIRIPSNEHKIGFRRLIRFGAALLPVTQRAKRDVITICKFLLRQL